MPCNVISNALFTPIKNDLKPRFLINNYFNSPWIRITKGYHFDYESGAIINFECLFSLIFYRFEKAAISFTINKKQAAST